MNVLFKMADVNKTVATMLVPLNVPVLMASELETTASHAVVCLMSITLFYMFIGLIFRCGRVF